MSSEFPPQSNSPLGQENNPFTDNPYAAPFQGPPVSGDPTSPFLRPSGTGMVRHVPIVAILMIVQGVLETLAGLGLVVIGCALPTILQVNARTEGAGPPAVPPEEMLWVVAAVYGGLGIVMLVAAGLHVFAGIRNARFRSRTLGLCALFGGMVTVFTCYCLPTAICLMVYGLYTYLNPETTQAFAMGEAGRTKEEILAAFRL
ncbi:MAG: hypothetical protein ACYC3X_21240 [Pirellulaceae bacterium]